ncbi:MAG: hypothetical protein E7340_04530 [Clostridiales bacterium]|nr:hypothetical protein [Clostridiales bacterium]
MEGWKYYNHAVIPTCAPHEVPDLEPIKSGQIWKEYPKALFARWTEDFDCDKETDWWYVIKDTQFDITTLKSKRRYEINKGNKFFDVKQINPIEYKIELYNVQVAAFSAYPQKYRPNVDKEKFIKSIDQWGIYVVLGAFCKDSGELAGYALLLQQSSKYVGFSVLKTKPNYEKFCVNAALVEGVLKNFNSFLEQDGYICDGARSISHETAFQDYLEKYFGFKKAYCKLKIKYNPKYSWLIKILYVFRKILIKFDGIGIVHNINAVLKMEEICRKQKKENKK